MSQVCTKCYIEKPFDDFYFRKDCNNYHKNCKACQCKRSEEYYYNNIEHKRNYNMNYQLNNKDKLRDYHREYKKERYHRDHQFRLKELLSGRIHYALKELKNNKITMKYLGCTIEQFYNWIEFQFYDGMNWENQGSYWHLDHTLPVSSFNFENEEQIKTCFNWKNLRPLRADKNKSKYNKLILTEYLFQEIKSVYFLKQTNI